MNITKKLFEVKRTNECYRNYQTGLLECGKQIPVGYLIIVPAILIFFILFIKLTEKYPYNNKIINLFWIGFICLILVIGYMCKRMLSV